MASALKVGGVYLYVGSPVGPGPIKAGDKVRVVRVIGSAVRIIPSFIKIKRRADMDAAFLTSGVGVNEDFLVPVPR